MTEQLIQHRCVYVRLHGHSPPGSSVLGIFQARTLGWIVISYSRGSSQHRGRTQVFLHLLHWQVDSLPLQHWVWLRFPRWFLALTGLPTSGWFPLAISKCLFAGSNMSCREIRLSYESLVSSSSWWWGVKTTHISGLQHVISQVTTSLRSFTTMRKSQDSYFTYIPSFSYLTSPSIKIYFNLYPYYTFIFIPTVRLMIYSIYSHVFPQLLMITVFIFLPQTLNSRSEHQMTCPTLPPGRTSDWTCLMAISMYHNPTIPVASPTLPFSVCSPTTHSIVQPKGRRTSGLYSSPTCHESIVTRFPSLASSPFPLPPRQSTSPPPLAWTLQWSPSPPSQGCTAAWVLFSLSLFPFCWRK